MDIENTKMKVRVNNFNEEHFKSLGYNVAKNEYIEIFIKELPKGSGLKIDVECNFCGKVFKKAYRRYLETKNNLCCKECKDLKMVETSIEKYGFSCSLRNKTVQNKSKEKNMKNLGVQFPFQNKSILEKCVNTSVEIYGKKYMGSSISRQQKYFHNLYGGILNYSEFPYRLDIFLVEEKIYFEYDGSGHELSVKMGRKTKEEFDENEILRKKFLKEMGYREFRIISNNDVLPEDNILMGIKERALIILKTFSSYIYNLNTKTESFEE
jgi:hypothetical protein